MKRKLVKQGSATMMVSLPSKWIKKNELEKGDEVDIEEVDNTLVISEKNISSEKKEIEMSIDTDVESAVRIMLVNAYRLGYDRIKINFKDEKVFNIIKLETYNHILGFELISKTNNQCIIENITEPSKDQFDNIFSKIILNIEELLVSTEKMLKGDKVEYSTTEQKIMQYANFCRRILTKEHDNNYALKWSFHVELIHGQRELYHLMKYLEKNKVKYERELIVLLENCKDVFNLLKKAYYEKKLSYIEEIHRIEKEITYKKGYPIFEKTKSPVVAHNIMKAHRDFYLASSQLSTIININK